MFEDLIDLKNIENETKDRISFWLYHSLRFNYVDSVSIRGNKDISVRINYESEDELKKKLSKYMYVINYFRKHPRIKSIGITKKKIKTENKMWFGEISSSHGSHTWDVYYNVLLLKLSVNYKY